MLVLPLLRPASSDRRPLLAPLMLLIAPSSRLPAAGGPPLFRLLCGLLLLFLLLDLATGSRLLQSAWMSYSVVEGARFYGIGNEYMGVAIGVACVLFGRASRDGRTIMFRQCRARVF